MIQTQQTTQPELDTPAVQPKKRNAKLAVILLVLLLLLLGGFFAYRYFNAQNKEPSLEKEISAEMGFLPNMSDEEIKQRLNQKVAESMLNVSMNPQPKFKNGSAKGNVLIENIPANKYAFTVELFRYDNSQQILKTGLVYPGYFVETIALDVALSKGEYLCLAVFTAYHPDTQERIGEAGLQCLITVEE